MSISREELVRLVVAKLAFVDNSGNKRVRIDAIAKITGLENRIIETNILRGKISTLGEDLDEENAEKLIGERLLNYTHPEIEERLFSDISQNISEAVVATTQISKPISDLKSIIEKFIIVDGSNVLHWMRANKLSKKIELIPLLIALTAIKKKGFDFCCYYDASQWFQMREQQPDQFRQFVKLRENEKYRPYFSEAPGGTSADDFILLDAKNSKRKVLSNDRFRDNPIQLPESQFIRGAVVNCQISIPKLHIIESLVSDLKKAVRDLELELNK